VDGASIWAGDAGFTLPSKPQGSQPESLWLTKPMADKAASWRTNGPGWSLSSRPLLPQEKRNLQRVSSRHRRRFRGPDRRRCGYLGSFRRPNVKGAPGVLTPPTEGDILPGAAKVGQAVVTVVPAEAPTKAANPAVGATGKREQ
jgi:hypothetical protein